MMSLETIDKMTRDAGRDACQQKLTPYLVWPQDLEAWKQGRGFPIPFPMIGDYVPEGWEADGEPLFVDTSGFGSPGEPALTMLQLLDAIEEGKGYAFTQQGQFQAYLQAFEKTS
jgi:hypothetical protein